MATVYKRHEQDAERFQEVEHASFIPIVLSCTGSAGAMLAEKSQSPYSPIIHFLVATSALLF